MEIYRVSSDQPGAEWISRPANPSRYRNTRRFYGVCYGNRRQRLEPLSNGAVESVGASHYQDFLAVVITHADPQRLALRLLVDTAFDGDRNGTDDGRASLGKTC